MALKNTTWHGVKPGNIVSFVYKGKNDKKGFKRTILLVNPDLKYRKKSTGRVKRFVVGLQLDTVISAPISVTKLENLFGQIGGVKVDGDSVSGDLSETISPAETKKLYNKLKSLVKSYNNWRTFDRRECMKRRVYLEVDYDKIPKDVLEDFQQEQMSKISGIMENE